MITSFSWYILSFILYSISASMFMLILATVFFGLGDAFRTGTHKAMIFDYLEKKGWTGYKVHYYGHTRSWSQAGSAVSSLFAAALVFYSGKYLNIFLYSVIPYALGLLLILSYPGWLDGKARKLRDVRIWKSTGEILRGFLHSLRDPGVFRGILNVSSHSGYYRAVRDYLQPLIVVLAMAIPIANEMEEERKSALLIGLIYFLIYLLSSLVTRRSGDFNDRFRGYALPLNLTLAAGFIAGTVSGLSFRFDLPLLAVCLFVLIYLVENLRMPAGISWFSENVSSDVLATALSTESQGKSIFTALLALGMGTIADRAGPGTALLAVSVIMLVIMPLFRIRDISRPG
jgi:hypothetical protein